MNDISSGLTQVLAELDADGNEKCFYTRGAEIISQDRNGTISYYLTDGHGSVRQLADSTGAVTDTYVYDAWGNLISSTGNTENSYLYCGEQLDSVTGLYYLRARYMNPATGTFISMDTYQGSLFDPVSLHKYLYANANPVMNIDPSGYNTITIKDVATAFAVSAIVSEMVYSAEMFALNVYKNFKNKTFGNINLYVSKFVLSDFIVESLCNVTLVTAINVSQLVSEIFINDVIKNVLIGEYEAAVLFTSIRAYISEKVDKLQNLQKTSKRNLHHIVAQTSKKAIVARAVLLEVGIPINSSENLVSIKEDVHWFMHTDVYYAWVNSLIYSSYTFIGMELSRNVQSGNTQNHG